MSGLGNLEIGPRESIAKRHDELAALQFEHIRVTPMQPVIGALVEGVRLSGSLLDAAVDELRRALVEFKVLCFRDQDVTIEEHLAFAELFGELEEHPFIPSKDGYGEVVRFQKSKDTPGVENQWHSDVSWREIPSLGSVLRAVEVPEIGGDTLWSDMEAAYESLEDEVKERCEGLVAVHDFANSFGLLLAPEQREAYAKKFPPVEHPVIRTHPVSGRRSIYVNRIFTSHIEGLPREEGDALLRFLFRQAQYPEYQCRLHWEPNSVAFWDNRSVQHYAANDYWPQVRVMERVTIIGDRPR